jgi:nitrous oxide reductase accessory protein NosL
MFVYKYPDWTAQIIFKDGSGVFFDGAKDMFKYYLDRRKFEPGGKPGKEIAAVYVLEYYGMKTIDAAGAYFVVGSDVYGPMGHELIPLATKNDAETFKIDHNGKEILRFQEITRKVIDKLD